MAAPASEATTSAVVIEGRKTKAGCSCKKTWVFRSVTCDKYCCNPDGHPGGDWCLVVEPSCEKRTWSWCAPTPGAVTSVGNSSAGDSSASANVSSRHEDEDEQEAEESNVACGSRMDGVRWQGLDLVAHYKGSFSVHETHVFEVANGHRTLIDSTKRDDAMRKFTVVKHKFISEWDGHAPLVYETAFTDGCRESKALACSVLDGSNLSESYPCGCGASTCSVGEVCLASSGLCHHSRYANLEACLHWEAGECGEYAATVGKTCSEASCCGNTSSRNYVATGTCECIKKCNHFFKGGKLDYAYAVLSDKRVYKQPLSTMSNTTAWTVTSSGDVTSITIDGDTIYAVGTDNAVRKQNLYSMNTRSHWKLVAKGNVKSVVASGDIIYGVRTEGQASGPIVKQTLSTMTTASAWTEASKGNLLSIVLAGDIIYGVGTDYAVHKQPLSTMSTSTEWAIASKPNVVSIAIYGDKIYGIGAHGSGKGQVLKQRLTTMTPSTDWTLAAEGDAIAIAIPQATTFFRGRLVSFAVPPADVSVERQLHSASSTATATAATSADATADAAAAEAAETLRRLSDLSERNGGCHTLRTQAECLTARDGRSGLSLSGSACHWCCGKACTPGGALCEPGAFLLDHPGYSGQSKNGLGDDTCPLGPAMHKYDLLQDLGIECSSSACTCADDHQVVIDGIGLAACQRRCLEGASCAVLFCEGSDATCDCHEYAACLQTREPSGQGSHYRKIWEVPPCGWTADEGTNCSHFSFARYVVGSLGARECPSDSEAITDVDACRAAATLAGFPWGGRDAVRGAACSWCGSCSPPSFRLVGLNTLQHGPRAKPVCLAPIVAAPTEAPVEVPSEAPSEAPTQKPTEAPTGLSERPCFVYHAEASCPRHCTWNGSSCGATEFKTTNGLCTLVAANKHDACCKSYGVTHAVGGAGGTRWPCVMRGGGCQGGGERTFQEWLDHCHHVYSANPMLFDDRICVGEATFQYECHDDTNQTGEEADWVYDRIGQSDAASSRFVLSSSSVRCPMGAFRIRSAAACKTAAQSTGNTFIKTYSTSNMPGGCLASGRGGSYPKGIYYNDNPRLMHTVNLFLLCTQAVWGKWTITRMHTSSHHTHVDHFCGKSSDSFSIARKSSPVCSGDPLGGDAGHFIVTGDGVEAAGAFYCVKQGPVVFDGAPNFVADQSCEPDKHFMYATYGPTSQMDCCDMSGKKPFLDIFDDGLHGRIATVEECYETCIGHDDCLFYAINPTATKDWCSGFSSCERQCKVDAKRPHTVYSIEAQFSVFTDYGAHKQNTCCDQNGIPTLLDLYHDGLRGRNVTAQQCYEGCKSHGECKYFAKDPDHVTRWCQGFSSCEYQCPADLGHPLATYSLMPAAPLDGCARGYKLETHDPVTGAGDVCRMASWNCPYGCEYTSNMLAPYCVWANSKDPCHARADKVAVPYGCAPGYLLDAKASGSALGDVCKMQNWSCPIGCTFAKGKEAPYCVWKGSNRPCHVAAIADSTYTKVSTTCELSHEALAPGNYDGKTYRCLDGTCTPRKTRCNGVPNCKDGSDEQGCETPMKEHGSAGLTDAQVVWMTLYSTGDYGTSQYNASEFNALFHSALDGIVRRECNKCAPTHRDIYFKRMKDKESWDAYEGLVKTWRGDVGFHTDFDIFPTYTDALAGTNTWKFCDGNAPGVGFPRECGPAASVAGQFTSILPGGQISFRYSLRHSAPTPTPSSLTFLPCRTYFVESECPHYYCRWAGDACATIPQIPVQQDLTSHVIGCSANSRSEGCSTVHDGIITNDFYTSGLLGAWIKLVMDAEYTVTKVQFTQRTCCDACVLSTEVAVEDGNGGAVQIAGFRSERRSIAQDLTAVDARLRGSEFTFTASGAPVTSPCTWGADEITLFGHATTAICGSFICPSGYSSRAGVSKTFCAGSVCSDIHDRDTCCEAATYMLQAVWCGREDAGVGRTFQGGRVPPEWHFSAYSKHSFAPPTGTIADFSGENVTVVEGMCGVKFSGAAHQVIVVMGGGGPQTYGFSANGEKWETTTITKPQEVQRIDAPLHARYFVVAAGAEPQECRQISIIPLSGQVLPLGYRCDGHRTYMGEATCFPGNCPRTNVSTMQECADECTALAGCNVFMHDNIARCFLKSDSTRVEEDHRYATWSCSQVCPLGYHLKSGDLPDESSRLQSGLYAASIEDCASLCDNDLQGTWSGHCRSFEFHPLHDTCDLNSELAGSRPISHEHIFCAKDPHSFLIGLN